MPTPAKFLFDKSFERPGERRAEPRAPSYGAAEMEAAMQSAFAYGRAHGAAEAKAEAERDMLSALARLEDGLARIAADYDSKIEAIRAEAATLAFAVARQLAGPLVEQNGADRIEAALHQCLGELRNEPRIVVRATESIIEKLKCRIERTASASGYPGHIVLLPDDTLASTDCRIEWADGGAAIDQARLEAQVADIIRAGTASRSGDK